VAENNKLTGDEVWSMVESVAEKILPIDVENLTRLGIDEISLAKGQGKFIVVLVDLDTHKLIGLVAEGKRSEIEKVMRQWGEKVLSQIKEVSMDMTGNYKSLVKKLCPNADAIVDRFHVTKMLHEELNQARIAQKKERAKLFNSLKGSKYTLLKAEDNLSNKQKQKLKHKQKHKLKQVKEASPLGSPA
jgi:transposase